jgi:subtilisin family serine protease
MHGRSLSGGGVSHHSIFLLVGVFAAAVLFSGADPAGAAPGQPGERARIVVGFKAGVARPQREQVLARGDAVLSRDIRALRANAATVPADQREAILARLRAEPSVAFAEVDQPVRLVRPVVIGKRLNLGRISKVPDDEGFSLQYALSDSADHDIDATAAWNSRTSCSTVAVIDTGIDTGHKDLKDNIWVNEKEKSGNGIDDDHDGYVDDSKGVDLTADKGSGVDENGHGTHAAGIIAAEGDNQRGVSGLCWKSRLMSIRIMDADGAGYTSSSAEGIVYAVDHGARIINASYTSPTPSDLERNAIQYAQDHDTLLVAAAGNDGRNADAHPSYPAAYPNDNVISVAATTDRDKLASYSNYGPQSVDLGAPGDAIASTWDDGGYRDASGTSMAAPLVAAAAAMLRKAGADSFGQIRNLLLEYADDKSSLKGKVASGGRLNINRALNAVG